MYKIKTKPKSLKCSLVLAFVFMFSFVFGGLSGEVLASTQETNSGGSVTYKNIPQADYEATVEVGVLEEDVEEYRTPPIDISAGDQFYRNMNDVPTHRLSYDDMIDYRLVTISISNTSEIKSGTTTGSLPDYDGETKKFNYAVNEGENGEIRYGVGSDRSRRGYIRSYDVDGPRTGYDYEEYRSYGSAQLIFKYETSDWKWN